jgi:D-arabinose 1-dehydrogenase-like Zn-dependent alcohol dehydrogenase
VTPSSSLEHALTFYAQVGAPEDKIPSFNVFAFIMKGVKFGGSAIGSPADIAEMLVSSFFSC